MKTVGSRIKDIKFYQRKAEAGEIPFHAVMPMAIVHNALRRAQVAIGPGHFPLDALFYAMPEQYRNNWLNERKQAA